MKAGYFSLVVLAVYVFSQSGLAAENQQIGGPKIQQYQEVERGFWIRTTMGIAVAVIDHYYSDSQESPIWPPGFTAGIEMGVDFGQIASIHAALCAQQITGIKIVGTREVSNDGGGLQVMLGGRFSLVTTKRFAWFLKASAGYMFSEPDFVALESGVVVRAGTGIEYATNLRHFFIGLEALGQYLVANGGISAVLQPTLKYAF